MSAINTAKAAALAAWRDFRGTSKFTQQRVWIGLAFVAAVVLTIIAVVPAKPPNRLQAYVLAARADFIIGSFILVRNDSSRDWEECRMVLNGTHTWLAGTVRAGAKVRVQLKYFQAAGKATLKEAEVRVLEIHTSRGSERYNITFLSP